MTLEEDALDLWIDGRRAGMLLRGESGDVELIYESGYLDDPSTTPLSASMPKNQLGYGPDRVMPWLSNLLPDAVEVRDRWAAKFGERRNDPFTLLSHMGQDAPGSVQIVAEGVEPTTAGTLSEISESRIAERIAGILADPDHWVDDTDEDESRFSLGGNQGKFALARVGDRWFEPNGRAASTHIVKPGMLTAGGATNEAVQAVEFVTMRAAGLMGLPSATVEIRDFAGTPAFVTTRFDRVTHRDGSVSRIHQEDFCQALGVRPSRKYEEDGGPSMADMRRLVGEVSSPAYLEHDLSMLTGLFGFNLLIAGVDAHAKNHSLLLAGGHVRLAPAYDLISALGIWDEERVQYRSSAAVKYGRTRRFRRIAGSDLARTADVLRVDRVAFVEQLHEFARRLPDAFESSTAELPQGFGSDRVLRLPESVRNFSRALLDRVDAAELSSTPPFEATPNFGPAVWTGVWVPGHRVPRRGWVSGHYRKSAT